MVCHIAKPLREGLGVAVLAPRTHLRAAADRVPRRVSPFDFRVLAHTLGRPSPSPVTFATVHRFSCESKLKEWTLTCSWDRTPASQFPAAGRRTSGDEPRGGLASGASLPT